MFMSDNSALVGKRIKKYRKKQGLSQELLAEKLDCTSTNISYIENGNRNMSLDSFIAIANALHISADELLIDCLESTVKASNHEFAKLIHDCSDYELHIMLDVATSTKNALRLNLRYLPNSSR